MFAELQSIVDQKGVSVNFLCRVGVLLGSASLLAGCVTSPDGVSGFERKITAVSGERTRFDKSWSLQPNCSAKLVPDIRITQQPLHGKAEVAQEKIFPNSTGYYKKCSDKQVEGAVVYYQSDAGYVGPDALRLRKSFKDGKVYDKVVDIKVVK